MHELKAGLNADKFATFRRFPKNFYQSFVLQMTFIRAEIRFRAKTIVTLLLRGVYSNRAKSNVVINFSLCGQVAKGSDLYRADKSTKLRMVVA